MSDYYYRYTGRDERGKEMSFGTADFLIPGQLHRYYRVKRYPRWQFWRRTTFRTIPCNVIVETRTRF